MNNDDVLDKVTFHLERDTGRRATARGRAFTVTHVFDATDMNTEDMFMRWVHFMNGVGYVLDPVEMEEMWDGVEDKALGPEALRTEKLTKAIEALEGVKEFVGDLYPHTEQGTVLVPQLSNAVETLEELKQ